MRCHHRWGRSGVLWRSIFWVVRLMAERQDHTIGKTQHSSGCGKSAPGVLTMVVALAVNRAAVQLKVDRHLMMSIKLIDTCTDVVKVIDTCTDAIPAGYLCHENGHGLPGLSRCERCGQRGSEPAGRAPLRHYRCRIIVGAGPFWLRYR